MTHNGEQYIEVDSILPSNVPRQDSEGQRGAQLFEGGIEAADLLQAHGMADIM